MSPMNKISIAALGAGLLALGLAGGVALDRTTTPPAPAPEIATTADVEAVIKSYVAQHPELVITAIQTWQAQQAEREQSARSEQVSAQRAALLEDESAPVAGNPNGDVTIVEFFDYNCPYCKRAAETVSDLLKRDDKLRVVFKELPILRPDSVVAARAGLAAYRQDKATYLGYHERLMATKGPYTEALLFDVARDIGLDVEQLKRDMEDPEIAAAIRRTQGLARDLGIRGTPAFVIGGRIIPGAADLATLEDAIESERAKADADKG